MSLESVQICDLSGLTGGSIVNRDIPNSESGNRQTSEHPASFLHEYYLLLVSDPDTEFSSIEDKVYQFRKHLLC